MDKKNIDDKGKELICGECASKQIETIWDDYEFPYGVGEQCQTLVCKVPIRKCKSCGFQFIDDEAEDLCHAEVCRTLGVMPPSQIKKLRELHKMSQSQFCAITKLGEATLSRWERGVVIQNQAYDNYLFLLGFDDNMTRIQERYSKYNNLRCQIKRVPIFRELKITDELLKLQTAFELQPN